MTAKEPLTRLGGCLMLSVLAAMPLLGCPGPDVHLNLELTRSESLEATLGAARVSVRERDADHPEIYGPFETTSSVRLSTTVTAGADFFVSAWGCAQVSDCTDPAGRLAAGCTTWLRYAARAEPYGVELVLNPLEEAELICPPAELDDDE